ncbi:hypothetical protein V5E97_32090 [Singulisphaera sp. Ch08]|uniref:Uncharacterized protein n=1 Tax=Singulisphaera sp. Ch08 TaxID=3120278 RepID=A0AAU7CCU7_9BACT
MWRQGDVLISAVEAIPPGATCLPHCVLAEGEVTGHSHRVEGVGVADLLADGEERFLRVNASTVRIVHQEHGTITLPRGLYRVWQQREYTPEAIRTVRD